MELTNTEGITYKFRGSLCADFDYEGTDLSELVRDTVGMDDLYVFDGNCKSDVINRITLDYHRLTKIKPKEVPEDFADFAETVVDFIRFYGLGEILDSSVYGKVKRRKTEYIYCSVIFDEGYKSYYYLTDDDSIEIGDFVLVPVGKDNHEAVVRVVNVEYFGEDDVPLPVEKTKHIMRKCTDDDFDLPKEYTSFIV